MENYDMDTELSGILNKHSDNMQVQRDKEIKKQEIIQYNYELAQRAIATSTKREEIAREAAIRGKEITKERRKKVALILVGMATVVALSIPAVKNVGTAIDKYKDTSTAISIMQEEAIDNLSKYGLINENGEAFNIVEPNTSVSYQRLDISSPEEVYVYKTILSDTEFNKLISSLSYSSFEEYLKVNGFSNEKEFVESMRESILNSYRSQLENNGGMAK